MLTTEARHDLLRRMRKIEGQTQGIQRMLEGERDCQEVLNQLASVRAATRRVSLELARHYVLNCLNNPDCAQGQEAVDEMIKLLLRA
jgi:CsoR family transcriptional regulator, copper-sensing transcriptional repressor